MRLGIFKGDRRVSSLWLARMAMVLLTACTADAGVSGPDLSSILAAEKAQSLAAAKIGKSGGRLEITGGDYAGVILEIPPGALAADAVISIYPGVPVTKDEGYLPAGPAIRLAATVSAFRSDATLTLPFFPDTVSEQTKSALVFLQRSSDQIKAAPGVSHGDEFSRAPVREFLEYSIALDQKVLSNIDEIAGAERCPTLAGGTTLQGAIQSSRLVAGFSLPSTAQVLKARSFGANGCGYSLGWEVIWFSVIGNQQAVLEVWPSGVSDSTISATKPACASDATAFKGQANSTTLSQDLADRLGVTPVNLNVSIRTCNDATPADPARIRLEDPATGNFAEYSADGVLQQMNF